MPRPGHRRLRFTALLASAMLVGCAGGFVAVGPTLDAGTLAVSGVATGTGGHLEAGWFADGERGSPGIALSAAALGYQGEGDGDPIFLTALEGRYRRPLSDPSSSLVPFVEVGAGPVAAWLAGPRNAGAVAHLAVGLAGGGAPLGWWVALRDRPILLIGRQAEFLNSAQLVAGIRVRRGPR